MNKKILCVVMTAFLAALLAFGVCAEDAVVRVGADADVATLAEAFAALDGKGGTVLLCGAVACTDITVPEQTGDLTIAAEEGGSLSLDGTLTLEKNTNANKVTLDMPLTVGANGATIFGGFNTVHFTENFVVTGSVDFYGGVAAPVGNYETNIWDEKCKELNLQCLTDLAYSITVDNGNFGVFMGGNYRADYANVIGSVAEIAIVINGGTFTSPVSYTAKDALKIDPAFSVSGMSFITDKTSLTITGGEFHTPIYVQGYIGVTGTKPSNTAYVLKNSKHYYAADGDVTVHISGGTFGTECIEISAEQTAASYNRVLRGNFDVTVGADATFAADTVFDATQVKAYEGENAKATLTAAKTVSYKRFDVVNGVVEAYDEPIRIACLGDSITQGTGVGSTDLFPTKSYPAQLYTLAAEKNPTQDVIVSNYGCASYTVMNHGDRWYNSGLAYVLSQNETDADYIVLGLGTNDVRPANYSVGRAAEFTEVYEALVDSYEKLPSTKKVFGTSAIYRKGSEGLDIASTCVIRPLQKGVLTKETALGKRVYVDLYALLLDAALDGSLLSSDQLHPTAAGYTIYAQTIYDVIFNGKYAPENFEMEEIYVEAGAPLTAAGTSKEPIGDIVVALGKAADTATIYIRGTYNHERINFTSKNPFVTPYGKNITFKGDGDDAVLGIKSKLMYAHGDVKFDNITLDNCHSSEAIHLCLGYHNAEFTETFKSNDGIQLNVGYMVYSDMSNAVRYTSAEAVSSDRDCTVTVNGGKFVSILGGNFHYPNTHASYTGMPDTSNSRFDFAEWGSQAPYGTYSGTMTLTVGEGVTFGSCMHKNKEEQQLLAGIVGMNYLTGTINATIGAWGTDVPVRDYAMIGTYSSRRAEYNEAHNTGTVNITLSGITNDIIRTGDLDRDGAVTVADALQMLRYAVAGVDETYDSRYFYDKSEITLIHALRALKKLAK